MTLPVKTALNYTLIIPSTKEKKKYRPFTVREQKDLLFAQQSEDVNVIINTLKNVINSCVINVDVEKLALFDIEYIFTQLRAKSTGEIAEIIVSCENEKCADDPKAKSKVAIDLTQLQVEFPEGHSNKIHLFDDVGVGMKYPTYDIISELDDVESESQALIDIILKSIEYVYDTDDIHYAASYTKDELSEFLLSLDTKEFAKLAQFYVDLPKLSHTIEYTCSQCEMKHKRKIVGLNNFF